MKRLFTCALAVVLLTIGCGKNGADASKIAEANKAIAAGEFEKGIAQLDALGKEAPADSVIIHARADSYMKYATYLMYESPLPPKQKYSTALKMYRAVVKLDPANDVAKKNIAVIEGIYQQMGRPIPD